MAGAKEVEMACLNDLGSSPAKQNHPFITVKWGHWTRHNSYKWIGTV
jgi:hypothetical protein